MVGLDFSAPMLERARAKAAAGHVGVGNALELPYEDDGFDAATVGFGVRNVADLDRGIAEIARVVRPVAGSSILEITTPQRPPLRCSSRSGSTGSCRSGHARRRPRRLRVPAEQRQALR